MAPGTPFGIGKVVKIPILTFSHDGYRGAPTAPSPNLGKATRKSVLGSGLLGQHGRYRESVGRFRVVMHSKGKKGAESLKSMTLLHKAS